MEWRFKQQTPNDTLTSATHLEFFRDEALSETVRALVREDIQNHLDAHDEGDKPVRVRYHFSGAEQKLSPDRSKTYFNGIKEHLLAPESLEELDSEPDLEEPLSFLTIEDFNTRGLEGDPDVTVDPVDPDGRNDYFWFIRNVGRSKKKGTDRGRWGLGKIVYSAASHLRSFFAYTVRQSDLRRYMVGRSVLATHRIGDHLHDSEGYFGNFDDPNYQYNVSPVDDSGALERFREDFCLSRKDDEPGLSLVIPVDMNDETDPVNPQLLVESVLEYYYRIILLGDLVIEVSHGDSEIAAINKDTIDEVIDGWDNTEFRDMMRLRIGFAREAEDSKKIITLTKPSGRSAWGKVEEWFAGTKQLEQVRSDFMDGELVTIELPVKVERTDGTVNEEESCLVYLQNDDTSNRYGCEFLREGLAISGLRNNLKDAGVSGLLIVDKHSKHLSALLGDSENPAHTKWVPTTKHFRRKYRSGVTILKMIGQAPGKLAGVLGRTDEEVDTNSLRRWFSIPTDTPGPGRGPGGNDGPGETPPPPPPPPPNRTKDLQSSQIRGGFRIARHPKAAANPVSFTIRAAYEALRGSPWKKHHQGDFDFHRVGQAGGLQVEENGVTIDVIDNNTLRATITAKEFSLLLRGFDPHRDLITDIRSEYSTATGTEEGEEL